MPNPLSLLRPRAAAALVVLAALLCAAPPAAAQGDPPAVHVIATGGTISNTSGDRFTGEQLVEALPGLDSVARVTVEQFSNIASGSISLEQWLALSRRIRELYRERPELAGVVVTHGTDTMEETAYFLDLTVGDCRPVIVTGAMRRATDIGADGPANLFNAIRVAASPEARGTGATVLLNDRLYPGREVAKMNTSRVDAFHAPGAGPLAVTDRDRVAWLDEPARACGMPAFDVERLAELPRVDVVLSYLGADGSLLHAAADAGARGVVLAGVGRGGSTPGQRETVQELAERGVAVVVGSRTGSGRVPVRRGELDEWAPGQGARIGAGDLAPVKARILLMLALTRTQDARELAEIFETH